MVSDGLMYFFGVQVAVAHQFSAEKQHGNLVAVAHFRRVVGIDVEYIDAEGARGGQSGELAQHLLAKAASGARVQQEPRRRPEHGFRGEGVRRRRKI